MEHAVGIILWCLAVSSIFLGCLIVVDAAWRRFFGGRNWLFSAVFIVAAWVGSNLHLPVVEERTWLVIMWKTMPFVGGTLLFLIFRRLVRDRAGTRQGE